jgi:hypothetical protein
MWGGFDHERMTKDSVVLQRRKLDPAFHRCVFFFCASLILSARSPIPGARFACDRFEISRPSGTGPWGHLLLRSWKTSPTPPAACLGQQCSRSVLHPPRLPFTPRAQNRNPDPTKPGGMAVFSLGTPHSTRIFSAQMR